jgi:hypothetical protein
MLKKILKTGYKAGSNTGSIQGGIGKSGGGKYGALPNILQERFFTNCASGDPVRISSVLISRSNYLSDLRRW